MNRSEVYELCKEIAPKYGFDPILILAMCKQESTYDMTEARPEPGYYRKYTRPRNLPTTDEILLAASYGFMQVMGQSLYEMGYFGFVWKYGDIQRKIDEFMVQPETQVEYGCRWLRKKMDLFKSTDVRLGLRLYNGSSEYPPLVLAKFDALKKEIVCGTMV